MGLGIVGHVLRQKLAEARRIPENVRTELAWRRTKKRVVIPELVHDMGGDDSFRRAVKAGLVAGRSGDPAALVARTTTEQYLEVFNRGVEANVAAHLPAFLSPGMNSQAAATPKALAAGVRSVLKKYKFGIHDSKNGFVVSFVQPPGVSLQQMAEEINVVSQAAFGRDAINPDFLQRNVERMKTTPVDGIAYNVIPVVKDSRNYTPDFFKSSYNRQDADLEKRGLAYASDLDVILAAALYRLDKGFSGDSKDTGTAQDPGDLLRGGEVRVLNGHLLFREVGSFPGGLDSNIADRERNRFLFAAGRSLR